ncbi:MAG: hypothetical protein JEZ08_01425 [Clostridiales bacterium]|nr:hypothetical protein [Clostridiales bacterium]
MQIKRVLMIILVLTMLAVPTYANESKVIQEEKIDVSNPTTRFSNISVFYNVFEITSGGKALLTSSITSRGTDKIKIVTYLQSYENRRWVNIKTWSTTQPGTICVLGEQWYVTSGHQYRMKSYAYVYKDNQFLESTVFTSNTKLY